VARQYYLRFVLSGRDATGPKEGAFIGAYELKQSVRLHGAEREKLENLLAWFEANLRTPDRLHRTTSKGFYRRQAKGLSWFKPGATTAIRNMRELSRVLARHGYSVEELRTVRPGFVTYEDEFQVVADPFAETPI
jgi:hypothetical protein